MKYAINAVLLFLLMAVACKKAKQTDACESNDFSHSFTSRNFSMGFTTWPFGADYADRESTYAFIDDHADIYSEQFDNYIPWKALLNRQPYPKAFTDDIASRLSLRPQGHKLLVSVSLLNIPRDELLADADGYVPPYVSMNDTAIVNAYSGYLKYLIELFHPDYLVLAMEVNEFRIKRESKWAAYKSLVAAVKSNLRMLILRLKWQNPLHCIIITCLK